LGLKVTFEMKSIDTADAKIWEGVTRRYWWGDKYFLPKCVFRGEV
jgi:protein arginine N-methyltransferase 2